MSNITISFETRPIISKVSKVSKELKAMEAKFIVIDDGQKELRFLLKEDINMNDILSAMYEFTKGRKEYNYSIAANIKEEDD